MILESLSKAIREQTYYAVLLELLIVIVGLVLGFQIQAWHEARGERETERLILCRLASDFEEIVAIGRRNRDYAEASLAAAEAVVASAAAGITAQSLDAVDMIAAQKTLAAPAGSPTYTQWPRTPDARCGAQILCHPYSRRGRYRITENF